MKRVGYCYSASYERFEFGEDHPFKPYRLRLAYELSKLYGLFADVKVVEPTACPDTETSKIHDSHYLHVLKSCNNGVQPPESFFYNLGTADNPVFKGVYDWSSLVCGGSLDGARRLCDGEVDIFFSPAGGMHHAMPGKAYGFCYLNDAAVAINYLTGRGKRVLYVDTDAHHGDGVQKIFYETSAVMTASFHESGRFLFPGTGFEHEMGEDDGLGFSVNVPLYPYTDDDHFERAFFEIVPPLAGAFRPDVIVTQLGVDGFHNDPLATLNLTTRSFEKILGYYRSLDIPWLALGGGGYNPFNVARSWTLALAAMTDRPAHDPVPDSFSDLVASYGLRAGLLRDTETVKDDKYDAMIDRETSRVIEKLKKHLFPYHHLY